jgi:hypothetical protein
VIQRALGNVALKVTFPNGESVVHYFNPGAATYLLGRYSEPISESGLCWQVERTEET